MCTAEEVVRRLGGRILPLTLIRWARMGRVPGVKVGRGWLFDLRR